jgi:hypothetical protein
MPDDVTSATRQDGKVSPLAPTRRGSPPILVSYTRRVSRWVLSRALTNLRRVEVEAVPVSMVLVGNGSRMQEQLE